MKFKIAQDKAIQLNQDTLRAKMIKHIRKTGISSTETIKLINFLHKTVFKSFTKVINITIYKKRGRMMESTPFIDKIKEATTLFRVRTESASSAAPMPKRVHTVIISDVKNESVAIYDLDIL